MKPVYKFLMITCLVLVLTGLAGCQSISFKKRGFDLEKFLVEVFDPQPGEVVLFMVDRPPSPMADNEAWFNRRQMAKEWMQVFEKLAAERGFSVLPTLTYAATGEHNAPLPERGSLGEKVVPIDEVMAGVNIVLAMTEYSASGPLIDFSKKYSELRVASMPMISAGMQATALGVDNAELRRKAEILAGKLDRADAARVEFSSGQVLTIDLRDRTARVDDARLDSQSQGSRVINLPGGEAYIAPYEGEKEGQPSLTEGTVPILRGSELLGVQVVGNQVIEVLGESEAAGDLRAWFEKDPARRNLAELGLGCNDSAVISGNVLEDEKVLGMHIAFGRSDHFGGAVGVDDFMDPANVAHWDIVFPNGGDIEITSLVLEYEDGSSEEILHDGRYTIFKPRWTITVEQVFTLWLFLVAGSLITLAVDLEKGAGMKLGAKFTWGFVVIFFGPIGLLIYYLSEGSSVRSGAISAAPWRMALASAGVRISLACIWMVIFLLILVHFVQNTGPAHILGLGYAAPIIIFLFAFAAPIVHRTLSIGYWRAARYSVLGEITAYSLIFAGMFPLIFYLEGVFFPESIKALDPLFWVMISLAGLAGAVFIFAYEYWAASRGVFQWAAQLAGDPVPGSEAWKLPSLRYAWGAFVISIVLFIGSLWLMVSQMG